MFELKEKLLPLVAVDFCLRKWKKMVSLARKSVFVSSKMAKKTWFPLAGKSVSPIRNNLPLAGIFFKNWILPNFNNGFH